jgi:hypothetical protein
MSRQSNSYHWARKWVIEKLEEYPGITPKRFYEGTKVYWFSADVEQALTDLVKENRARCINGRWFLIDINSKKDLDKACIV